MLQNVHEIKREVWQRGPVKDIPGLLQPVAHALLQAREELSEIMAGFPQEQMGQKPGGAASPAFHLLHLTGVLDRLFTYAKQLPLNSEQLDFLSAESKSETSAVGLAQMIAQFNRQVDICLDDLSKTDIDTLTGTREIGRQKIPTTLIGLYVHAAEHTMRHIGQLLVTVRVIKQTRRAGEK